MKPSALALEFTALLEITCFPNDYKDYERSEQIAFLFDEFTRKVQARTYKAAPKRPTEEPAVAPTA